MLVNNLTHLVDLEANQDNQHTTMGSLQPTLKTTITDKNQGQSEEDHVCIRYMRKKWICALLWMVLGMQGLELVTTFLTKLDNDVLTNMTYTILKNNI